MTGIADVCPRTDIGTARRPLATLPMNVRRSITESPQRRVEGHHVADLLNMNRVTLARRFPGDALAFRTAQNDWTVHFRP
jgi:hypothetical protein